MTVWDTVSQRILWGNCAPLAKNLDAYLASRPNMRVWEGEGRSRFASGDGEKEGSDCAHSPPHDSDEAHQDGMQELNGIVVERDEPDLSKSAGDSADEPKHIMMAYGLTRAGPNDSSADSNRKV